MPSNFVKVLDTQTADVEVNQLQYDTSLNDLGDTLLSASEAIAEKRKDDADTASLGNFYSDIAEANLNIETNRDMSELQRIELIKELRDKQYDNDPNNDAAAINKFNRELESLNLREAQQGVVLDSNKRALVRRWMNIRPDLTPAFQKALGIDKAVSDMRSQSATAASSMLTEHMKLQQQSLAERTTVGMLQYEKNVARRSQLLQDQNTIRAEQGKMQQRDFDVEIQTRINEAVSATYNRFTAKLVQAALAGDPKAVMQISAVSEALNREIRAAIWKLKAQYESEYDIYLDDATAIEYATNLINNQKTMLTTGDVQNLHAINKMLEDDKLSALWHQIFPYMAPEIAAQVGPRIFVNAFEKAPQIMSIIDDPRRGLPALARAERAGDPNAMLAMSGLRAFSSNLATAFEGSPLVKDDNAVRIMGSYFQTMLSGLPPDPGIMAEAGPILAQLYSGAANDPRLDPDERRQAHEHLISNTVGSYDNVWRDADIMNPNSDGAKAMRNLPRSEWEKATQQIANVLEGKVRQVAPEWAAAVKYTPGNPEPFSYDMAAAINAGGAVAASGSSAARDTQAAIAEMNKYYRMMSSTRPTVHDADTWADEIYSERFKQENVQTVLPEIVVTPEELEKAVNGN